MFRDNIQHSQDFDLAFTTAFNLIIKFQFVYKISIGLFFLCMSQSQSQSQAVKHLGWVSFVIWMLAKNETLRITLNANQMTPLLNDELSFSIYRSAYTMYVIHAELSMSLQLWLTRTGKCILHFESRFSLCYTPNEIGSLIPNPVTE